MAALLRRLARRLRSVQEDPGDHHVHWLISRNMVASVRLNCKGVTVM